MGEYRSISFAELWSIVCPSMRGHSRKTNFKEIIHLHVWAVSSENNMSLSERWKILFMVKIEELFFSKHFNHFSREMFLDLLKRIICDKSCKNNFILFYKWYWPTCDILGFNSFDRTRQKKSNCLFNVVYEVNPVSHLMNPEGNYVMAFFRKPWNGIMQ